MKVKHPEHHSASLEITNKEYCNLCPPEKSKYNLLDPLGMAMHKNFTHPRADPNTPTNLLCHTCEQSFSKKDTLRIHIKMAHFNLKVPQCDVCSKLFSSEHGLTYHWKVAVCKREPIPCGDCNEHFLSKIELKVHRSKEHPVQKQLVPWPCHICGKTFKSENNLKIHLEDVHGDKEVYCDQCMKMFKSERLMLSHRAIHLSKTIKCTVEGCECMFSTNIKLKSHINKCHIAKNVMKKKEKRYMCDQVCKIEKFPKKIISKVFS